MTLFHRRFKSAVLELEEALEIKGLKIIIQRTKVTVRGSEGKLFKRWIHVEFVEGGWWPIKS